MHCIILYHIIIIYCILRIADSQIFKRFLGRFRAGSGFEAIDVVDALGPMWTMTPDDDELFEVLEQKIYEKLLNLFKRLPEYGS